MAILNDLVYDLEDIKAQSEIDDNLAVADELARVIESLKHYIQDNE